MKRCLCCGLPSASAFCGPCARVFCLPWDFAYVFPAWTSVALRAGRAERDRQQQVYRP